MSQIQSYRKSRRVRGCLRFFLACAFSCALPYLMTGCVKETGGVTKLRDIPFTVLDKDEVPKELDARIIQKREKSFFMTYADQGYLYIAQGYGERPTSGYSIEVNALYETEDAIHVYTNLMGPEKGERTKESATYPYVVIKLENIEKEVVSD